MKMSIDSDEMRVLHELLYEATPFGYIIRACHMYTGSSAAKYTPQNIIQPVEIYRLFDVTVAARFFRCLFHAVGVVGRNSQNWNFTQPLMLSYLLCRRQPVHQ